MASFTFMATIYSCFRISTVESGCIEEDYNRFKIDVEQNQLDTCMRTSIVPETVGVSHPCVCQIYSVF